MFIMDREIQDSGYFQGLTKPGLIPFFSKNYSKFKIRIDKIFS